MDRLDHAGRRRAVMDMIRVRQDWQHYPGLTFTDGLGLLFIGLKLTHIIDWSWVWVLSPAWIMLLLAIFSGGLKREE
jgi:hypothetical protein